MTSSIALLLLVLAWVAFDALRGVKEYREFKSHPNPEGRRALFRNWTLRLVLGYTLGSLILLAVLGRLDAILDLPHEFSSLQELIRSDSSEAASTGKDSALPLVF